MGGGNPADRLRGHREDDMSGELRHDFNVRMISLISLVQGVTKRCRLSLLTNSALVIRDQMRGEGGVAGSQPMSTAVHIT